MSASLEIKLPVHNVVDVVPSDWRFCLVESQ
jgi:hypothetical protein